MGPHELNTAKYHLSKTDPVLAGLIRLYSPYSMSSPSKRRSPYFHTLVESIINQQLSVKAGQTIVERLRQRHGGRYFNAKIIYGLRGNTLRKCGVSQNKIRYIKGIAEGVLNGTLNFRKLVYLDDNSVRQILMQFNGIGEWSADMFMIKAMNRQDILPIGDLVLRKSIQKHYGLESDTSSDHYIELAESWRPYRTIASRYLWAAA